MVCIVKGDEPIAAVIYKPFEERDLYHNFCYQLNAFCADSKYLLMGLLILLGQNTGTPTITPSPNRTFFLNIAQLI